MTGQRPGEPRTSGPWTRNARETVYENPWISVWHDEVTRPDGGPGIYGVVHFHSRAVAVVAVRDDGSILLVGQHRYTLDAYSWELPEGGVGPDESLVDGARRELREETGVVATTWTELCRLSLSNSVTDETGAIFVATGLTMGDAAPEPTEELATRWAGVEQVLGMVDTGEIHDVLTIAGVSRYALMLARERGTP